MQPIKFWYEQIEVLSLLMDRKSRAPRILAHGRLQQSGEAFMVTEPLGAHLDQSCSAVCIAQVICDVAEVIISNSEGDPPILHRDISAANIIMDSQKRGFLIDYHVGWVFKLIWGPLRFVCYPYPLMFVSGGKSG